MLQNKFMKICYIYSNAHLSSITGQAGLMMRLIQKTRQKSFQVSVISNDLTQKQFNKDGINYYLIKGLGDFKTYFYNFFPIINYLSKIKPDIIYVNGILMTIYVWIICRFLKIPFFSLVTETIDNINPVFKRLFSFSTKDGRNIFVTSDFVKKQLIEIGVDKSKIVIVRIGLDEKYLKPYQKIKENIDVLYFGDSNRDRGFDHIVSVAKKLKELQFKILIRYQENNCKRELELAKKLPNVTVLFYPYQESLNSIIIHSKLVVLPFRWMLIRPPISLLESMALGKCVITTAMPGNEEIVQNNINGFIMEFTHFDRVVSKINSLIINPRSRNQIGKYAKNTIKIIYSESEYDKIIDHYVFKKS